MHFDDLSNQVIGCSIEVHRLLGPGLLESAYEQCLAREMALRNIPFALQVPLPIEYKGMRLECGYRIDVLVDGRLIVELKAVERVQPLHRAQILSYMKLAGVRIGLLMNFNVRLLHEGIQRLVL